VLDSYALLMQRTTRPADAAKLTSRAKAIRSKTPIKTY
jgi:hypothetical protein